MMSRIDLSCSIRGSALIAILLASTVSAQTSGGAIRGTVFDPSGAVVPAARLVIRELRTGRSWNLVTTSAGLFNAPNLPVGTYKLTITATGFAPVERPDIEVQIGSERVVNVQLSLSGSGEVVNISQQTEGVELATSQTGAVNGGGILRELPLNGRDWPTLAALQPEVAIVWTENSAGLSNSRGNRGLGTMMAIAGTRPEETSYRLDGVNVNDYAGGGPASTLGVSLGVDAIEEFSVITGNAPADYGWTSGGVIDAVTRGGSNEFHGSAYEFVRNSAVDARNFFDGASAPPFKRNQFGGALGGPVRRQRTFFFVDYEGIREGLGVTTVNTVPSPAARAGQLDCRTRHRQPDRRALPRVLPAAQRTNHGRYRHVYARRTEYLCRRLCHHSRRPSIIRFGQSSCYLSIRQRTNHGSGRFRRSDARHLFSPADGKRRGNAHFFADSRECRSYGGESHSSRTGAVAFGHQSPGG